MLHGSFHVPADRVRWLDSFLELLGDPGATMACEDCADAGMDGPEREAAADAKALVAKLKVDRIELDPSLFRFGRPGRGDAAVRSVYVRSSDAEQPEASVTMLGEVLALITRKCVIKAPIFVAWAHYDDTLDTGLLAAHNGRYVIVNAHAHLATVAQRMLKLLPPID